MTNSSSAVGYQNETSATAMFSKAEMIGWCVGFGVIDIFVIISNFLTIVVFTRSKLLRKRTYYFLLCLAIADMMVGTISLPLYIHSLVVYTKAGDYNPVVYQLPLAVDIFSGFASIIALTIISLDRFYSVALPNWHRTTPGYLYCILITSIWALSGVFLSIRILEDLAIVPDKSMWYCTVVSFSLFLVVICFAYIGIWVRVMQRINEKTRSSIEKDKRLAKTLFLITSIFFLTWGPFQGINFFLRETDSCCGKEMVIWINLTKMMQYINSFINPIIYTFKMPDFRRVFLSLLGASPYGMKSTRASSKMLTDRRKRASTLRTSDGEPNGNCENAVWFIVPLKRLAPYSADRCKKTARKGDSKLWVHSSRKRSSLNLFQKKLETSFALKSYCSRHWKFKP